MMVPELLLLAAGVLLARVGLALQVSGLSRAKNAGGGVLRVLVETCVTTVAFWAVGSAILLKSPEARWLLDADRLFGRGQTSGASMAFYVSMILLGTGVMTGALVERSKFFVTMVGAALLAGLLIPMVGFWTWYGVLAGRGLVDVGGAGAVHVCGAVVALVAGWFVGPRANKLNRDGSSNMIPGHSLPLAGVGTLLMLVAWIPYLAGASLLHNQPVDAVAINVLLAGSGGALAALAVGRWKYGKPDWVLTVSGLTCGLVSVSAGGGAIPGWSALLCGVIAGTLVPTVMNVIDLRLKIDDPTGLIAVHLAGGSWGLVAGALFYPVPWEMRGKMLALAAVTLVMVVVLAGLVAGVVFGALHKSVGLRSKDADEFDGLDLAEHDLNAYPDFQQTMIKSYHLREA